MPMNQPRNKPPPKPARRVSPAERAWLNNINLQLAHEEIMQAKRELWLFERPAQILHEDGEV